MRGGDCEDGSCDGHVSAYSLAKLRADAKGVDDSVKALLYIASLYCPLLIESAINFGKHVATEFSRYNSMPFDSDSKTQLCLHLYLKLIPWSLLKPMLHPLPLPAVKRYSSKIPVPEQLDSLIDADTGLRVATDPRFPDLPVLAVEPTDHNQTNWKSPANTVFTKKVLKVISSLDLPNRVSILYPATLFDEERFYLWDIFCYSKVLFELTGREIPYWGFVANDSSNHYGVPPIGLLHRHLSARLRPAPKIHPALRRVAERAYDVLPLIPALGVPAAPPCASGRSEERRGPAGWEDLIVPCDSEERMVLVVRPGGRWGSEHGRSLAKKLGELRPPVRVTRIEQWGLMEEEESLEVWHVARES
jgi:hypothetical protein